MQEQYKNEMDQIHAPKELVEQTKALTQEEIKKQDAEIPRKVLHFSVKQLSVAASVVLILLVGGIGYYRSNYFIRMDNQAMTGRTQLEGSMTLGKHDFAGEQDASDKESTVQENGITVETMTEKNKILEILWTVAPSRIKGQKVYLSYDKENDIYYAGYKTDGGYCLVTGEDTDREAFLGKIKEEVS